MNNNQRKQRRNKAKTINIRRKKRNPTRAPAFDSITTNSIMPSIKTCTLKYLDASSTRNSPGNNFLVYAMRINDLFDPDPLILSGSVSNFKEMMQFYSTYRVMSTAISWEVANLETFPLCAGIVFSQTNLTGTIANLAAAQDAFENDFVIPIRLISGKSGMDRTTFRTPYLSLSQLLGAGTQYRSELSYTGQGLATPSVPLWANFIVYSSTGAALANGYANTTTLNFRSEFFGRLNVRA